MTRVNAPLFEADTTADTGNVGRSMTGFNVLDDGGDRETRVDAGDAQDNEYLLDQIIELGARVTQLEKLLEGNVEHASTEAEVLGALAANILRRKA